MSLNELTAECRALGVNHKDAFWLRGHLQQFDDVAYWDVEKLQGWKPKRNPTFIAVDVALHAPSARLA